MCLPVCVCVCVSLGLCDRLFIASDFLLPYFYLSLPLSLSLFLCHSLSLSLSLSFFLSLSLSLPFFLSLSLSVSLCVSLSLSLSFFLSLCGLVLSTFLLNYLLFSFTSTYLPLDFFLFSLSPYVSHEVDKALKLLVADLRF